jgi:hypothetical protein
MSSTNMTKYAWTLLAFLLPHTSWCQFAVGDLPTLRDYQSQRSSSYDLSGGNGDYRSLSTGQTLTLLDTNGPGEIRHIWMTMPPGAEAYALQKTVLRAYWDGEEHPSVEAPLGNFFGVCFATPPVFQSALITVNPEGALNCYFPMPFAKHARLTVTYEGARTVEDFYWNIDWVKQDSLPTNTAYFHAQYRQAVPHNGWYKGNFYGNNFADAHKDPRWYNLSGDYNYVILDTPGDGQFVGVMLAIFNNQWGGWNEGDDMIWIDGEKQQRINGTGGEDYFNAAWGFGKLYNTPLVGLVEFTGYEPGSRNTMYRWHLEAPIRFHKAIKVTIEDGHASMRSDNIYSVAYWYQMEPHTPFPPLPPAEQRIPKTVWTGGAGQDPKMK